MKADIFKTKTLTQTN